MRKYEAYFRFYLKLCGDDLNLDITDEVFAASDCEEIFDKEVVQGVAAIKGLHLHDLLLEDDVAAVEEPVEARA